MVCKQAVSTEMSPQGFSVTYAQEPPSSDAQSKAEQDGQTQQPRFTFTDVTKMPVGAERRLNMPRDQAMLMPGYFTPLNSHLTRSITIFATPNDKASAFVFAAMHLHDLWLMQRHFMSQHRACKMPLVLVWGWRDLQVGTCLANLNCSIQIHVGSHRVDCFRF